MLDLPEYSARNLTSQTARIKMLTHRKSWIDAARPNQLGPQGKEWDIWLVLAGRGFGKTRLAGERVAWDTWEQPGTITHVVASTHGDLRSVCYEGESGLLNIIPPECIKRNGYNRSLGEIHLTNGSIFRGYSAEIPDRIRGPQCHRIWGDELAAWDLVKGGAQAMFDMAMLGLRLGDHAYAVLTTTPKPIMLVRNLADLALGRITPHNEKLKGLRVTLTKGRTHDNFGNLSANFRIIISQYEGTRLGRQELDADILEDITGSLWSDALIEELRTTPQRVPELVRIVVSIDPAASNEEGSDETGIIVAGVDEEGEGYVLADGSGKYSPNGWAEKGIELLKDMRGDLIVGEVNNGGDMVEATIRGVNVNVPFKAVRASRGKFSRAEPVSMLYEQKRVHHVGMFPKLEDQMVKFTQDFDRRKAGYSPDRVDALVWAITELMLGEMDGQGVFEYYRKMNKDRELTKSSPKDLGPIVSMIAPEGVSTVFGRDGTRYEVGHNGLVDVKPADVATLRKVGFKEPATEPTSA